MTHHNNRKGFSMNGFYMHPRRIFELYISKPEYLAVCEVLLYKARFAASVEGGVRMKPGQLLIRQSEIADICSITVSQVRSALESFRRDGGITMEKHGRKGVLITLLPPFAVSGEQKANAAVRKEYKKNINPEPDSDASYDIRRAEERARQQVPKLKKRERR